jgi:putative flavoprotein involved in K+ transport
MHNRPITPTQEAERWLSQFGRALHRNEFAEAAEMFLQDSFWRDLVSFTWNIKTAEGREDIRTMMEATVPQAQPDAWRLEGEAAEDKDVLQCWFTFETGVSHCRGHLRLKDGKCWTLLTTIADLKQFPEKAGETRVPGVRHGAVQDRESWLEISNRHKAELGYSTQPYCVIIGGGQGGIALAARLKRLDVPTIVVERNARPGDSWRNRYQSLCLHDPVWYDHMPYLPFPDHWPVFSPKDKIADWLEMYVKVMEIDYWHSTECRSAEFDANTQEWKVSVDRAGQQVVLRPKQLVLATGMSGMPNVPAIEGANSFRGELCHSSRFTSGARYRSRQCIVLGSNNSAHDICADLWEHGADVTMIQRSSTHVVRSEALMNTLLAGLYSEAAVKGGMSTDKADLTFASIPYKLLPAMHIPIFEEIARSDGDFYRGLSNAGFLLDFGEDGSGSFVKYLRRGSGYYIDVGASELVASGRIKLKSGVTIARVNERSVTLSDGETLPADLIVYATGYGPMETWAARLISQEVADTVGKCWGLGSGTAKDPGPWEGELRNMWKPTRQPALWFHGGNLHQSRHYSKFLSLQLKARMEGIPTPVYD